MVMLTQKPKIVIEYIEDDAYTLITKEVARHGGILQQLPGQDQLGYGAKITTDRMVVFKDEPKVRYRVYCTCYSNAGSCWIIRKGQKLWLRC